MSNPTELFRASWGGIRLWASRVSTTNGRKVVVHDPSSGDEHPTQDRGLELRTTSCTLIFDDMEGETTTPKQRFDRFAELVELGEASVFTHPLRGSYLARVGKFDHTVDEDSVISAEVEFIPEEPLPAVSAASSGSSPVAGQGAVTAAADHADLELEKIDMSSPVTDDARAAAEAWQDDGTSVRRVVVDVGAVTDKIHSEIERLGLARGNALWPAQRALILLGEAVVSGGRAATADVGRLMIVRVGRPMALRSLLATIYGARDVPFRYEQARSLNDIRTPGWLEPGTELRLPQPTVQPRRG